MCQSSALMNVQRNFILHLLREMLETANNIIFKWFPKSV